MSLNSFVVTCAAGACICIAPTSSAAITTTNPGLYTGIDDLFEARMRLDGGGSQTWKTAFWNDSMIANSGIVQNLFQNAVDYPFSFSYNATTGDAALSIAGRDLNDTIPLSPGLDFAGFQWFVRSEINGSTTASDLAVSIDGGTPIAIPGLVSDSSQVFVQGPEYYLNAPANSILITGNLTFAWDAGVNLQGERFKLSFKITEGTMIPSPGAGGLLALGVAVAFGRRRTR